MRNIQTAVSLQPMKIEHMIYEIIYSELSEIPPIKLLTISAKTPCLLKDEIK
jgi:hypothetical protein